MTVISFCFILIIKGYYRKILLDINIKSFVNCLLLLQRFNCNKCQFLQTIFLTKSAIYFSISMTIQMGWWHFSIYWSWETGKHGCRYKYCFICNFCWIILSWMIIFLYIVNDIVCLAILLWFMSSWNAYWDFPFFFSLFYFEMWLWEARLSWLYPSMLTEDLGFFMRELLMGWLLWTYLKYKLEICKLQPLDL